jgi:hypothetical protein
MDYSEGRTRIQPIQPMKHHRSTVGSSTNGLAQNMQSLNTKMTHVYIANLKFHDFPSIVDRSVF